MKWVKESYGSRGYHQYRCGDYVIRQTHGRNIFTGKEMGWANQVWEIFKNGEKTQYAGISFKDAKQMVLEMKNQD